MLLRGKKYTVRETDVFLARLFLKKMSRYCHSPGIGGGGVVGVMRKYLCHNGRYLLEFQSSCSLSKGKPIPVGEVILHFSFLTKLSPFFDLEFSKCSYSRVLASAYAALVQGRSKKA